MAYRRAGLRHLRAQRDDLLRHLVALLAQQGGVARQGIASRSEQRAFLAELLGQTHVGRRGREQFSREGNRRQRGLLGLEPRDARALRIDAVFKPVQVGIDRHVAEDEQGLAGCDMLAVAHPDLAHDAAFGVLHRAAVLIDLDEPGCDHRRCERRQRQPGRSRDDAEREYEQARAHQPVCLAVQRGQRVAHRGAGRRQGPRFAHRPTPSTLGWRCGGLGITALQHAVEVAGRVFSPA